MNVVRVHNNAESRQHSVLFVYTMGLVSVWTGTAARDKPTSTTTVTTTARSGREATHMGIVCWGDCSARDEATSTTATATRLGGRRLIAIEYRTSLMNHAPWRDDRAVCPALL